MSATQATATTLPRLDLSKSEYDLSTYWGRAKHFFNVTDPRTILASEKELYAAKALLEQYRNRQEPPGTTVQQLRHAKKLYDSAFHPQTGELQFVLGRMSFQVPGNMLITGGMLSFYRSTRAVVFWQWVNQSFNALVNYTNRNASNPISNTALATAYVGATTAATLTALGLNSVVKRSPTLANGLVGRLVPFVAVAAANSVNIPAMRQSELVNGIEVAREDGSKITDDKGSEVRSTAAAATAITLVLVSRVIMAVPGMTIPPIATNILEKRGALRRMPWMALPFQTLLCGALLIFATPLACAIFPQTSSLPVKDLEPAARDRVKSIDPSLDRVYFNKGL